MDCVCVCVCVCVKKVVIQCGDLEVDVQVQSNVMQELIMLTCLSLTVTSIVDGDDWILSILKNCHSSLPVRPRCYFWCDDTVRLSFNYTVCSVPYSWASFLCQFCPTVGCIYGLFHLSTKRFSLDVLFLSIEWLLKRMFELRSVLYKPIVIWQGNNVSTTFEMCAYQEAATFLIRKQILIKIMVVMMADQSDRDNLTSNYVWLKWTTVHSNQECLGWFRIEMLFSIE